MNNMERVEFLFEDMNGKFDFLVEAVGVLQKDVAEMKPLVARIPGMAHDIHDMKQLLRSYSYQLNDHDSRIQRLEERRV